MSRDIRRVTLTLWICAVVVLAAMAYMSDWIWGRR